MPRAAAKVVPMVPRSAAGAPPLPSAIGHQAAQAELNSTIFPHYLLGRQLALEQVVRELLKETPPEAHARVIDRLRFDADQGIERLQDGIEDAFEDAATCGYVCALLQMNA